MPMTVAHDICFNYKRACVSVLQRFRSTGAANQQSFHIQSPGPRKPSRAYQQNKMFLKVPTYPQQKNATSSTKVGSTIWALWSCTTPFSSACTNPHWEIGRGHDEPPNTCNTMTFVNNNWWTQEFWDTFPWELKLTPAKMSFESVDLVLASVSPTGFFWGIGRAVFVSGALLASAPSVFCFCFSPG